MGVNEGRTLSVSEQLQKRRETDRERSCCKERHARIKQKKRLMGYWRTQRCRLLFQICVIYKFTTCHHRRNKRKLPTRPAVVEGLKLKTASTAPRAAARGFIWLVSTGEALAVLRPVWTRSSFSSVFRSGPNLAGPRLSQTRFTTWRDAGQKLAKSSSLED